MMCVGMTLNDVVLVSGMNVSLIVHGIITNKFSAQD